MFSDFLIFCFGVHFEVFGALSGYFLGWGGAREVFRGLRIKTDKFYFVGFFLFSDFFIVCLFGPYRAIFGVGVGSKNFFGLCVYRLTTFVSKFCSILIPSCSQSLWWGGGGFWSLPCLTQLFVVLRLGLWLGLGCDNKPMSR